MRTPEILVVGFQNAFKGKYIENCNAYGLDADRLDIQHMADLPSEAEMEGLPAPIVVILNAESETATRGLELIRQHWHYSSVIVCAERAKMTRVHQLLAKGATDFMEWPFTTEELTSRTSARVGAYYFRSRESTRQIGSLTLNMMQRTVSNGRDTAFLTPIETKIVATLAESLGRVIERSSMKQMCWGDMSITDNALNRKIYEVRRTLRKLSEEINIRTIYGLGFELEVASAAR